MKRKGRKTAARKKGKRQQKGIALQPKTASAGCKKLVATVYSFIDSLLGATGKAVTSFAGKPYSVPVFIIAAMLSYAGIIHLNGYRILALQASMFTFPIYLCDYSVGFCSRLLVGAILSLFTDKVSVAMINLIVNWAVLISLVIQAVIAGLLLRAGLKNRSVPAALIGLLFMADPSVVLKDVIGAGMPDVYLLLLFLLWLALLNTPLILFVTPVICMAGMTLHYEFLFTYLPPMLTLLLYYAFFSDIKRKRTEKRISLACGSVVSASSFFYFVIFANKHLKMTAEEFYQHMVSRFDISREENLFYTQFLKGPVFRDYFDYYLFGIDNGSEHSDNIIEFLIYLNRVTWERNDPRLLWRQLFLFVPVFLVISVIWLRCASREKGIRKLIYFCFIGQALVLAPELYLSTDTWRWVAAALMAQLIVFSVVYFDKKSPLHRVLDNRPKRPVFGVGMFVAAAAYIGCSLCLK